MIWSRGLVLTLLITGGGELALAAGLGAAGAVSTDRAATLGLGLTAAGLALAGLVMVLLGLRLAVRHRRRQRLLTDGVPGHAQVLDVHRTGVLVNGRTQLRLRLRVTTPVHGTWDATITELSTIDLLSAADRGQPVPVRVARDDRDRLVVGPLAGLDPRSVGPASPAPDGGATADDR